MKVKVLALSMVTLLTLSSLNFAATSNEGKNVSLSGVVNQPSWLNANQLLVKSETETGFEYYQLSLEGEKKLVLGAASNATEVVKSADGSQLAYVNDNGELYVQNIYSQVSQKLSLDHEPKMELQFSKDNSKLYFLMGEKIDQIAMIDLKTGKQTILLADKVSYKSDLQISSDGSKAMYVVTKAGTVNDKDESYAVDVKGTEPQLNVLDLTVVGAKPLQVTSWLDNKVFPRFLQGDEIVYISGNETREGMSLMKLNTSGKNIGHFVNHLDVSQVSVLNDGTLLIVGESPSYKKAIFKVMANGSTQKILSLPQDTIEVQMMDMQHIAVTVATATGEKVSVFEDGKFVDLTR